MSSPSPVVALLTLLAAAPQDRPAPVDPCEVRAGSPAELARLFRFQALLDESGPQAAWSDLLTVIVQ